MSQENQQAPEVKRRIPNSSRLKPRSTDAKIRASKKSLINPEVLDSVLTSMKKAFEDEANGLPLEQSDINEDMKPFIRAYMKARKRRENLLVQSESTNIDNNLKPQLKEHVKKRKVSKEDLALWKVATDEHLIEKILERKMMTKKELDEVKRCVENGISSSLIDRFSIAVANVA